MPLQRRTLLAAAPALLATIASAHERAAFAPAHPLARVRAQPDRLIDYAVCTRPFRTSGPRLEAQAWRGKVLVHNYGHGGSGWSLSWGSAKAVLPLVAATRERHIAVIGCGAIGLTTARVLQRAGLRVRIYCKDRPPEVRSSNATGLWSPDSRLCLASHATPQFEAGWEAMARASFKTWQSMLGLQGDPVAWRDGYLLSDLPFDQPVPGALDREPEYADLEGRLDDIRPHGAVVPAGEHPFAVPHVRRFTQMVFNLATYQRLLLEDFFREGGTIEQREFVHQRQLAGLPERALVNCTGYGARALFGDDSIIPVRGQTARLVPQPEVDYILFWRGHNVAMVPRSDGLLVQAQGGDDFANDDIRVDVSQSQDAVRRLAQAFR